MKNDIITEAQVARIRRANNLLTRATHLLENHTEIIRVNGAQKAADKFGELAREIKTHIQKGGN